MSSRDLIGRVHTRLDELLHTAARHHGEDPAAAGLLVAFSGGPDSMALLDLAARWAGEHGRTIAAAHFNHRLRGQDADGDEQFCRQVCRRLGIALHPGSADPRPLCRQRGRGLEEAARSLRLEFLEETRRTAGLCAVATGHHRDDQAETVLMRLYRGTGLDGLRGIRPINGRLIRPLLGITRAEILHHLQANRLSWRQDATNLGGTNVRSRVRRELLPLLEDIFGPGAALNPARLAELCGTDLDHLEDLAASAHAELIVNPRPEAAQLAYRHRPRSTPPAPGLAVPGLIALPEALAGRVVRRWLQPVMPADLALVHVRSILRWLAGSQSGTFLDLPGPLRLVREFDEVHIAQEPCPLDGADRWRVRVEPLDKPPSTVPPPWRDADSWRMICSADRIEGNLHVRPPRPGDRMQPFGLAGSKKLSDLVRERRIPLTIRARLLVVVDRIGPLWAVGVAQDERTRVLPATGQAVTITVERRQRGLDS